MNLTLRPIGTMKSVFHFKNGTPRQSSLCDSARGIITIEKSIFNNPDHSLIGLEEFSHAWIIFIFHKSNNHTKAKVKPPRLNGQSVGVFSSRSPYRPNNIGLSLVKIDKIEGASVHVSGIDILDGTPVIDIKPYIPEYDKPKEEPVQGQCKDTVLDCHIASDITKMSSVNCEGIGGDSCLTEQSQEIVNTAGVGPIHKESITRFITTNNMIPLDFRNEGYTEATDNQKCHEIVGEHRYNCGSSQGLKNSSAKNVGSLRDDQEIVQDLDPISEGFYAVSAALKRAGKKLDCVAGQCKSSSSHRQSTNGHEHLNNLEDNILSDNMLTCLLCEEDCNKGGLVDSISKTTFEPSVINSSVNTSCLSEAPIACELDDSDVAGITRSNCRVQKKTKNIQKLPNSAEAGKDHKVHTYIASWLLNPPVSKLNVTFTSQALEQLQAFSKHCSDSRYQLQMFSSPEEVHKSITDILREEPRSVYRRQHCQDSLYYFAVDILHVTCWFDENTAQVLRVKPVALVPKLQPQI